MVLISTTSTAQELLTVFPHVDFANVPPGADTLLGPGKVETPESADARIARFFAWLREQPQQNIACVAHFQILSRIFVHLKGSGLDSAYGDFANLEVRSIPIAFN
eukprot:g33288.t1